LYSYLYFVRTDDIKTNATITASQPRPPARSVAKLIRAPAIAPETSNALILAASTASTTIVIVPATISIVGAITKLAARYYAVVFAAESADSPLIISSSRLLERARIILSLSASAFPTWSTVLGPCSTTILGFR